MKRTAEMQRSPMKPSTKPLRARPVVPVAEPKPPKGPKLSKCAVKSCRAEFVRTLAFLRWCSPECGTVLALEKLAKQKAAKAKAERAEAKRRKEEGMPLKERKKATEALVNRYVLLRDREHGCISCHMPSHYDGAWNASHFKSVGSNSALRYNLWNIHRGCAQCNLFKSGNIAAYEQRLVLKIGAERVEWLKNHDRSREYTAEYLLRLSAIIRRKIARLERRIKGR